MLRRQGTWIVTVFSSGCLFCGIGIWFFATNFDPLLARATVAILVGAFGIFGLTAPYRSARRFAQAISEGVIGEAIIQNIEIAPQGDRSTFESIEFGMARGTREVHYPGGSFVEQFEIDAPWGQSLSVGSRISVLVDTKRAKSIFELGTKERKE